MNNKSSLLALRDAVSLWLWRFAPYIVAAIAAALAAYIAMPNMARAANETPYWAAMNSDEVNARVGPSRDFKIRWVYKRKRLPVRVIRVVEGWRLIEDPDGDQGWVVESLLTNTRGGLISGEGLAPMRAEPKADARLKWNLEPGVVGWLGECNAGWCMFNIEGRRGYVEESRIWGAGEP